ncbi:MULTISPECIES: aminotransferase class V-fold PLP-dependent enzyme [Methylobacterium]|uniref:aminotransferase class V-fold PLP-dependent enzyme n=1 Tax=Methylobacterium TaxID=407 RepID=UPI0011C90645|nr:MULTISPECIES: aminotransferase class V-fold PLP-dependent enzyme [Methylobacterium]TXN47740.1 aminotransferase class V-fold PLP-dependent enzyme [Methylobacterium sp. WL7]GJE22570.1 Isopenicillin N epimerase [Methylobacterium mesophilicum]
MPRIEAIPSQRHLFEVPADVSYLDAAAWSPLPRVVRAAGEAGILTKSRPWDHPRTAFPALAERTREAAARLIGAGADDVAIVGSVSHAMATAACNLAPARGGRLLRVADEFPSLRYAYDRLAAAHDLAVEEVPRPPDGDWTAALLAAIHKPSDKPLAIATLTPLHWTDGSLIDLDRLTPAVHAAGAALVIDATQAVGAMPVDVARWRPDFLAFPTYKWALGPYGVAFLYAAPHRQDGLPIEDNIGNRTPAAGARRYDRGELNDPVALSMAASGLDLIAAWGVPSIAARLRDLTDRLAEGVTALGLTVAPPHLRADHILGVHAPGGLPDGLMDRLQAARVFASERSGALRLSPHVWADPDDVARCLAALRDVLGSRTRNDTDWTGR